MADPQTILTDRFARAIAAALGDAHAKADPLIRASANPQFGDYQANVAMSLGKTLGLKPRDVAQKIVEKLEWQGVCEEPPTIAGPGFVNLKLARGFLEQQAAAVAGDERLGVPLPKTAQTVVIDYSGPNVAKEMHVGHLRSTVIGDAIARVLEFQGDHVIRQNHLGDWGTQFGRVMLGLWYESVAIPHNELPKLNQWIERGKTLPKKADEETSEGRETRLNAERALLGEITPWQQERILEDPDGTLYFENYVSSNQFPNLKRLEELYTFVSAISGFESASGFSTTHPRYGQVSQSKLPSLIAAFVQGHVGINNEKQEKIAWERTSTVTINACQALYQQLGVHLSVNDIRGESKYQGDLPIVVDELLKINVAKLSEGAICVFPPGYQTADGKPLPLIVRKSDGGYGYATTDLAALRYRIGQLYADRIIYVTDARQKQHFAMVFKVAEMAGWTSNIKIEHVPFGTILGEDNKPFKTRSGDTVKLADLLDEAEQRAAAVIVQKNAELPAEEQKKIAHAVGIGAIKYADLCNDRIKDYVFSWDRMLSFDGNTAPYLQNAYVRIKSIFRKAQGFHPLGSSLLQIADPAERALSLKLLQLPGVVDAVAQSLEPHRLCTYLYEVASNFHQFYEKCPVLSAPDQAMRDSRLALCDLTARVLKLGLGLLGIDVVEQM